MDKDGTDLTVHADSNQRITYANSAYCDVFGISDEEVVGYDFKQLIHTEDIDRIIDSLKLLAAPPHITHHEARAKTVRGWKWFAWTVKADIDGGGNITGIKAVGRDVTKIKQAQEELLQKKSRVEKVLEVGKLANQDLKLKTVLQNILQGTVNALNASIGMILLKDTSTGCLNWGASVGLPDAFINDFKDQPIQPGEGLSGRIAQTGSPIYIQKDSSHDPRITRNVIVNENFNSFIGVPIIALEEIVGVMNILTRSPEILSEDDLSVCAAIGTNVGMAIRNAHLFEEKSKGEEALRESEARYKLIAENMADIITVMDMDLNFTYVSPSILKLRGFTVEESMKQKIDQIMTPESFKRLSDAFAEELRLEQTGTADPKRVRIMELEEYRKDGSTIWVENTASFIRDNDQKTIGILVVSRDITDRKRAEEALKERESLFSQMFEQSTTSMCLYNPDGTVNRVNNEFCKMFGVEEKVIINAGYNVFKDQAVIDADIIPLLKDIFEQKKRKHWEANFDIDVASASTGTPTSRTGKIYLEVFGYPVLNREGNLEYVALQYYDITERKQAELALQESEEKFRTLFKDSPIPTSTWQQVDDDFVLCEYNSAALTFTQGGIAEIIGIKASAMFGENKQVLQDFKQCLQQKLTITREMDYQLKTTGERKHLNVKYAYVPPDLVMLHALDFTDRKEAEEALRESEEFNRSIIDNSQDCNKILDLHGRLEFMSKGGQALLEIDDIEPFLNNSWIDFWKGDDNQKAREAVERGKAGEVASFQGYCPTSKGTPKWWDVRISPIYNSEGKVEKLLSVSRDITQQKRAEEALRSIERRNQALLDHSPVCHKIVDLDFNLQYMSANGF